MMARRRTQLLILLSIASALAMASSWIMLDLHRRFATASQNDRSICLTELAAIGATTPALDKSALPDDLAINRRLRGAAIAAHLSDQLASIEPGAPSRLPDSDYSQTPIYIRLNAISLKQLVGFLYELSLTDNTLGTSDIELSPPLVAPPSRSDSAEVWTADVTLNYLAYEQSTKQ